MKLESRMKAPWNKGEFDNLTSKAVKHWLELNWYADGSTVVGPFREGENFDHLGCQADDFNKALDIWLKEAGYLVVLGSHYVGGWSFAFEGIRWTLARYLQNAKKAQEEIQTPKRNLIAFRTR